MNRPILDLIMYDDRIRKLNSLYSYLSTNGSDKYAPCILSLALDYISKEGMVKTSVRKNQLLHTLGDSGGRSVGILSPYRTLYSNKQNKKRYEDLVRDIQKMRLKTLGNFWHGKWNENVYINSDREPELQNRVDTIVRNIYSGNSDRAIVTLKDIGGLTDSQKSELRSLSDEVSEDGGEITSINMRQSKIPGWYTGEVIGPILEDEKSGDNYFITPSRERSVIIKDISFNQIRDLAVKYDQDAFIYRSADGVTGMYWAGGKNKGKVELATLPDNESLDTNLEVGVGELFTKSKPRGGFPSFEYDFWQSEMVPYTEEVTMDNLLQVLKSSEK